MTETEHISLKAFWDAVERRLAASSAEDLRAILRAMAQDTPPSGRGAFLAQLNVEPEAAAPAAAGSDEDLLTDIDDWIAEFQDLAEEAEPYEESYDDDWRGGYREEEGPEPYAELVEPLTGLFDRAEAAFDYGNPALARAAYLQLFTEALNREDDYGRSVHIEDLTTVDAPEARARYLRAVYETAAPEQRPQVMFDAMVEAGSWLFRRPVLLDEVIQISPRPLPGGDRFFTDWMAFLREQSGSDADRWLREAVRLAQGTRGLEELARTEGRARPRAFVDWLAALAAEQKPREVLAAAQLALETLPAGLEVRAPIADYLCSAAAALDQPAIVRQGRWEAFLAQPTLTRLLDVWDAAPDRGEKTQAMQRASAYVKRLLARPPRQRSAFEIMDQQDELADEPSASKALLAHAHLLAQELPEAQALAGREQVLGWSSGSNLQGLVVPCFLVLLTGPGALPPNLALIWQQALATAAHGATWDNTQDSVVAGRLSRVYGELIAGVALNGGQAERWQSWCIEITRQRVAAIVSNQHRGSYDNAATLTAACAEMLRKRGQGPQADSLMREVRAQFPRHSSFQKAMKAAAARMGRS